MKHIYIIEVSITFEAWVKSRVLQCEIGTDMSSLTVYKVKN